MHPTSFCSKHLNTAISEQNFQIQYKIYGYRIRVMFDFF